MDVPLSDGEPSVSCNCKWKVTAALMSPSVYSLDVPALPSRWLTVQCTVLLLVKLQKYPTDISALMMHAQVLKPTWHA